MMTSTEFLIVIYMPVDSLIVIDIPIVFLIVIYIPAVCWSNLHAKWILIDYLVWEFLFLNSKKYIFKVIKSKF